MFAEYLFDETNYFLKKVVSHNLRKHIKLSGIKKLELRTCLGVDERCLAVLLDEEIGWIDDFMDPEELVDLMEKLEGLNEGMHYILNEIRYQIKGDKFFITNCKAELLPKMEIPKNVFVVLN